MEPTASFGYWVRRRRRALDLTQEELAHQVGCAAITIKKIEADERRPSRQIALRLAESLQLAPAERAAFVQAARGELATDRLDLPPPPSPPLEEAAALPGGTLTFLFTDIEGSTKLWEQHAEAMPGALARHDGLVCQAVATHHGVVFKTTGDGVHAAFTTALHALSAALEAQRAVQAESWGSIGPIRVRMALHTGVAEVRDGDYYGAPLNRTARLLTAGHGGQVLLSHATADLVRDMLPPDAALRDMGEHWLKDLTRPEQIFQLVAPDLPADFPPLKTLDRHATNLPAQPTALIGREREVATLLALLRRADVRLVTLTGPGGVGKTRLSLQVAAEVLDEFASGAYFVALAPISDPDLVIATIAQTLEVREASGQPLLETLKAYLRENQLLLVLDNFEQVLEAAPRIAVLLAACPRLKVLITSREVLRLSGEHDFAVPPLALPDLKQLPPADAGLVTSVSQYAAVRLFIERAQAIKPDFAITNGSALAVAEICARLDGLPLAIELAAARIKLFAPQALLVRLSSRLKLLTGGARDLPARQQTLRSTIDWSYNLLSVGEQTLFARLAVFVGGWTLDAAEAVCDAAGDLGVDVLDGLAALVDQSLLQRIEDPAGEARFLVLETIHEYALEQLEASGEIEAIRQRHAGYFLSLAETAEPELLGAQQGVWLDRLEREHDNLRAALQWTLECGAAETATRLSGALRRFWGGRGHLSEGRGWLAAALAQSNPVPASVRAKALNASGALAHFQSDHTQAMTLYKESLALYRELGDRWGTANVLNNLGMLVHVLGDYARATMFYEESVALRRGLGDIRGIAGAILDLGRVALDQGYLTRGRALLEESLALNRQVGNTRLSAVAILHLGRMALVEGDAAQAALLLAESLALLRELGDKVGSAEALIYLGEVARRESDYRQAMARLVESLALFQELGDPWGIAASLEGFARISAAQEQSNRAARLFGAAAALRDAISTRIDPIDRIEYDRNLAFVRATIGAAAFAAAWAAGQAMSLEQAIAYALEGDSAAVVLQGCPGAEPTEAQKC